MLPHHRRRRPDSAGSDQFSFFSPSSDHLEYNTWAENLKTLNNPFVKRNPKPQFGPWARTIRSASASASYESSSPPLWKAASPESRPNTSRAQVIDRYRQEMMDLVRDLPETAYELSLKDMVELRPIRRKEEEEEEEEAALTERWEARKRWGKRRGSSNGSMDSGGFLLKFFTPSVPAVIGGGRKISPRPMAAAAAGDGEWSSGGFRDRSSSNGSSGSSCSAGGRQRWKFGGCYSFFYRHRRSRSN